MSVLIINMEMPNTCKACVCSNYYERMDMILCDIMDKQLDEKQWKSERHHDCPLIEIHTPHGRLGDLDELEKQFKRAIGTYLPKDPTRHMSIVDGSECRGWTQGLTAVQEAETVIEAED